MKNLRKLNPLVYWTLRLVYQLVYETLKLAVILIKVTLLIFGGFLVLLLIGARNQGNNTSHTEEREEHNPFVYGTQGKLRFDNLEDNLRFR